MVDEYMRGALAAGTQSSIKTAMKHFERFTITQGTRPPIITPRFDGDLRASLHNEYTFMLFAAFLMKEKGRGASTSLGYCSLLRGHLAAVHGFPIKGDSARWKRMAKAMKKKHPKERRKCHALRAAHLREARAVRGPPADAEQINKHACVVAGWAIAARPTELSRLKRSDLTFFKDPPHAVLRVKPLKKGPEQGAVPIPIGPGDGGGADAYALLDALVRIDPVPPEMQARTPLFRTQKGQPPSPAQISKWVQEIARTARASDPHLFSARSMRIGGATEMHAVGVDQLTLATMGRWDSETYRIYARTPLYRALRIAAQMSRAPHDPTLEAVHAGYTQSARR